MPSIDEVVAALLGKNTGGGSINGVPNMAGATPPPPPQQFAQNASQPQPAWMGQPLRLPAGQFTSPQGPLQVVGPAQYRNAMRVLGIQPTEYNKK
jgi:hypothetical protein